MQHLAIIPDGNRRWAAKNKLKSFFGHKKGLDAVKSAIQVCLKNQIKYLSIYTFSLENFNRSEEEKSYLFDLLVEQFSFQLPEFIKQGIKIRFVGDKKFFPEKVQKSILDAELATKDLDKLNLNLLFCYGAKAELVHAAKSLAQKVKSGELKIDEIDENKLSESLWTAGAPDPDLIIRTSNLRRLSNFLLYQAAYSELMFLDCFWPEVTENVLQKCVDDFKNIQRNFGK
jgi:undecaprenyl diphosphate synthase